MKKSLFLLASAFVLLSSFVTPKPDPVKELKSAVLTQKADFVTAKINWAKAKKASLSFPHDETYCYNDESFRDSDHATRIGQLQNHLIEVDEVYQIPGWEGTWIYCFHVKWI